MRAEALSLSGAPKVTLAPFGWLRLAAYLVAWAVAFLCTAPPAAFVLLPFFPLGLFSPVFTKGSGSGLSFFLLLLIWVPYALHGFYYFRTTKRAPALILYAILLVVLFLNVSGCHRVLSTMAEGL